MNLPTVNDLIELSDDLRGHVLLKYKLSENDVQDGVEKILEWFKNQPFMGLATFDRKFVENLFIRQKGSLEETKSSLINYYFLKISVPEVFTDRDPQIPKLTESLNGVSYCTQYPLSTSGERYLCVQFKDPADAFDVTAFYKLFFMELDMSLRFDYIRDIVFIIDGTQMKQEHFERFTRKYMALGVYGLEQALGLQIKSMHLVCPPESAKEFLQIVKSVFVKNTQFVIHEDLASLHRSVEPALLPRKLGGKQNDVDQVQGTWLKKLNDWRQWFLEEDRKYQAV